MSGQLKRKGAPKKETTKDFQKVIRFSENEINKMNDKLKESEFVKLSPFIRDILHKADVI